MTRDEIDEIVNALAVPPGDNGRVSLPGDGMKRLFEIAGHAIYEQSRIDAAVAKERRRCAGIALSIAVRDGLSAGRARERRHARDEALFESGASVASEIYDSIRTPTATTEEGA